jgi:putative membrane protein
VGDEEKDPRVWLAAERTLLAWIRTGLAMMGFGFVVARFGLFLRELEASQQVAVPASPSLSLYFGTTLVLMGVVANVWAALAHLRLLRQFREGTWAPDRHSGAAVFVAVTLACAGLVVAVYLLVFR